MPILRWLGGMAVMSLPSTRMRPDVGVSKPAIILRIVVLPQPEGPSRETNSPFSKPRLTLLTTVIAPKAFTRLSMRRNSSAMG